MGARNVYLINLSFGLAGIERRFANIWRILQIRGNVRPILVVPDTLAEMVCGAGLAARGDELLWTVREPAWLRTIARVPLPARGEMLRAFGRAWVLAKAYEQIWERIARDPAPVVHIGLNCSSLTPPDVPLVYECVDANLTQLGTRHYVKASGRRCIIHCQTERIRQALERTMARRSPVWTTVISPCYFASYPAAPRLPHAQTPAVAAFVGRLAPEKNPHLFLEAIAQVRRAGLDVRGLMLGEGPQLRDVRRKIRQLGLDAVVELGFSKDPVERLREASIFVTLQPGDNYGSQSLLEAMGAGCAVVATRVGETSRLVTPEVGLLVEQDAKDIARAIGELARKPERTARMGAAASHMVRSQYNADIYVSFLEFLYDRAVDVYWTSRRSPGPS